MAPMITDYSYLNYASDSKDFGASSLKNSSGAAGVSNTTTSTFASSSSSSKYFANSMSMSNKPPLPLAQQQKMNAFNMSSSYNGSSGVDVDSMISARRRVYSDETIIEVLKGSSAIIFSFALSNFHLYI